MDHEEHLLGGVLRVGVGDAEPAQGAPHEAEMVAVDLLKCHPEPEGEKGGVGAGEKARKKWLAWVSVGPPSMPSPNRRGQRQARGQPDARQVGGRAQAPHHHRLIPVADLAKSPQ